MTHACAHCGGRVADEAERCPSCGSPQRVVAPAATPTPADAPPPPAALPRGPRRSRLATALLTIVTIQALCAGIAVFSLLGADDVPDAPVATPAVTTGGFAALRERGRLRVAADPDAAPFLARTADGGFEGFEYGVMSALAAEAGVPLEVVPATFSTLPDALRDGRADLAIGQLSPSSAWSDLAWSVSYLQYSLCLVVPGASPIATLEGLRGRRVGMYDDPLTTNLVDFGVGAAYERVVFDDHGYFEKLAAGALDAVVYDCPLARREIASYGRRLRIADDALNVATYNAAVRKDDPALQADVSRVLRRLGEQGLLARLEAQWLGAPAPTAGYATRTGRVVVVRRGETLRDIAARELGAADRWTELHEHNRDLLGDDPDGLYAGLRLRVEGAPVSGASVTPHGRSSRASP